jgi:hypothetical protein
MVLLSVIEIPRRGVHPEPIEGLLRMTLARNPSILVTSFGSLRFNTFGRIQDASLHLKEGAALFEQPLIYSMVV